MSGSKRGHGWTGDPASRITARDVQRKWLLPFAAALRRRYECGAAFDELTPAQRKTFHALAPDFLGTNDELLAVAAALTGDIEDSHFVLADDLD